MPVGDIGGEAARGSERHTRVDIGAGCGSLR